MTAPFGPGCETCAWTGHVCENHPDHPWAGLTGGPECCGGAGMPCPECTTPPDREQAREDAEALGMRGTG